MEPTALTTRARPVRRCPLGPIRSWSFCLARLGPRRPAPRAADPFARFDLPDAWEARFWAEPGRQGRSEARARATWPTSSRPRPGSASAAARACDADRGRRPARLVGREARRSSPAGAAGRPSPTTKFPAPRTRRTRSVPEETVEVLPGVIHHYPYHEVEPEQQQYPDERLYLAAKRDYEAREYLAKAALYAAVRYHEQPAGREGPRAGPARRGDPAPVRPGLSRLRDPLRPARLAQVLPAGRPAPALSRGYRTAKWDWTGSLDVPLNLVIAYALLRDDPALAEAGRLLEDADPARTIERDLFRASAEFVRRQPEEFSEASLQADRGMLAVGRLLDDPALVDEALGPARTVRRAGVLPRRLLAAGDARGPSAGPGPARRLDRPAPRPATPTRPMLRRWPHAGGLGRSWPTGPAPPTVRAGLLARAGARPTRRGADAPGRHRPGPAGGRQGADALDLELRGLDSLGPDRIQRQALRLAVGGRTVLGDLDDCRPAAPASTAPPPATTRSSSTA